MWCRRVASVSIWIMVSPSGETTWASMRHFPASVAGGMQWAPMGREQPPPRASRVVRSASMAKRVWGCSRKATALRM